MMYVGDQGIYTYTFDLARKENCTVCGSAKMKLEIPRTATVQDVLDLLMDHREMYVLT
jgi:ubiquitin-activating enzyme E1 C